MNDTLLAPAASTTQPLPLKIRMQNVTPQESAMLPLTSVASRLGVKVSTARTWIRLGYIRGHRFGNRCYRVHARDLDAFIKAHETVEPNLPGEGVAS